MATLILNLFSQKHEPATIEFSINFDVDKTDDSGGELEDLNRLDIGHHLYFFVMSVLS